MVILFQIFIHIWQRYKYLAFFLLFGIKTDVKLTIFAPMDKVSVVILNWNGEKFLKEYLPALVENTPVSLQGRVSVVVADNNSSDSSMEYLHNNWPQIRTISLDRNYGFTGGYNRALALVEAEYFILMNSDILVPQNWLEPLITFMDSRPEVGICQPKMLSEARHQELSLAATGKKDLTGRFSITGDRTGTSLSGGKEMFEYAGACGGFIDVLGFPFCRGRVLSNVEEDNGQYDNVAQVFWASGACMVVRSSVWRELGGLDESFFAHMEEIDFCWRAQLAGHQVWAVPQSHVFHVGGGTLPNNSPRKLFFNYRNNLLMLYKNLPLGKEEWKASGLKGCNRNLYISVRMCVDGLTGIVYLLQLKWSFFTAVIRAHNAFRRMKKETAVTLPDNRRNIPYGISPKSLILEKLLGRNIRF